MKDSCLFREEFIVSNSLSPEENLKRRKLVLVERTMGLLSRLRILIRRILFMSDSCQKNTSFFPQEQNYFVKNYLMVYSSEKKPCSPPKMISI